MEYDIPDSDKPKLEPFRIEAKKQEDIYSSDTRQELESIQRRIIDDKTPEPHINLAVRFANLSDYKNAFKEIRRTLNNHPTNKRALYLGGELIVRFKLGVLDFKDDDYITFFKPGIESYSYIKTQAEDKKTPGAEKKPTPEPGSISITNALFKDSVLTFTLNQYQRAEENGKLYGKVEVTLTITAEDGTKRESKRMLTLEETASDISMRLRLPPGANYSISIKARDIHSGNEAAANPQME